ncbi:PD40 domain-containing protein [Crocinitomicaceae bacterium CZZ-1]|uniref:PD40 domain-containing protein n=1 Tax=Taishania pollutisoli TaxID=2766479 RepID=A0A8J6PRF5_9FLAO|nr:OmpA family protein [Taishania pollutisoli]MBC9813218.1 PD40 domain-containing protein [Taishania pollutisoli]
MKIKNILFTFSLIPWIGLSQYTVEEVNELVKHASESQLVVESSRMLQEDYYYFSEIVVDKLLSIKPESSNYNYRKGFIVLNSRNDFENALNYLEIGTKSVKNNYDMYSAKETSAPSDVYYHLGRCYHLNDQPDKAIEYYNLFIQNSLKKSELVDKAKLGIIQCEVAKKAFSTPKSAKVNNLNTPVNTIFPEYSPVVSLDGKSLYFTSRRPWKNNETEQYRDPKLYQYPEDIYVSIMEANGTWKAPKRLEFCYENINEATIAVSVDEKRIYTYQDVSGAGDIYYSDFLRNQFQILEQLSIQGINTEYWETHCTVTPDGKNIYFVSERPGGLGGRDIYRVVKMADGRWSEPQNLGPTINTPYDEDAPFISIDNKTMYFASNGPNSMGGFDIFVAVRDDNNQWSTPINLGYPINSTGDDLFYTTTVSGNRGYLSSFRKGGKGEKDIYEIETDYLGVQNVIVLNGNLHTIGGAQLPEDAYVLLKCNTCAEPEIRLSLRPRDGAFLTSLEHCKDYEIIFMKNAQEVVASEQFTTACNKEYQEIYKEAYLGDYLLSGTVTAKETGAPIANATVQIINKADNSVLETLTTDTNGMYTSALLKTKKFGDPVNYELKFAYPEHLSVTSQVVESLGKNPHIKRDIQLEKVEIGKDLNDMITIHPIYFDLDKSDIRPDAQIELDKIVKIMNDNPTLTIELGSHTDCRASMQYNLSLSDRRAKSSANYIKKRITNPSRIYGKGYGETKLVNDCACEGDIVSDCTEEQHQENRRTEFRIVKK